MLMVRSISCDTSCGTMCDCCCSFRMASYHLSNSASNSVESSSTVLSSATVRTITPKPSGLKRIMAWRRRLRSLDFFIFVDTETLFPKGNSTIYRPAKDISAERRGPLVDMGSLMICTSTSSPALSTSPICPSLPVGGCGAMSVMSGNFFLLLTTCLTYAAIVRKSAPRS